MVSLDIGTVDEIPSQISPAPTPAPTPTPSAIVVLPPELPATPTPVIVVLPPELPATPTPTDMAVVRPENETFAPAPAPQESITVVGNVIMYLALGVVVLSVGAICFSWLLALTAYKKEKKSEPSPEHPLAATGCIKPRAKSICKNTVLAGLAMLPPFDVASDIYVIVKYWLDWHPMWASFLTVVFVLSCRFVLVFAVLHPPPEPKVLPLLHIFPFRVAYKHKLAFHEPESRSQPEQAADSPEELQKKGAEKAERILGSCLPTCLRVKLKVR